MALNDFQLQELHQHYRDTCDSLAKVNALRERYTLYTVIVLSVMLLGVFGEIRSEDIVTATITKWMEQDIHIGSAFLRVILWFALLAATLKYFNMNVQHEKLIEYLGAVEDKLNAGYGEDLITREGKFYATNYPPFSRWLWVAYTIVFPTLLMLSIGVCIVAEVKAGELSSAVMVLDCLLAVCVGLSTVLYVLFLHTRK